MTDKVVSDTTDSSPVFDSEDVLDGPLPDAVETQTLHELPGSDGAPFEAAELYTADPADVSVSDSELGSESSDRLGTNIMPPTEDSETPYVVAPVEGTDNVNIYPGVTSEVGFMERVKDAFRNDLLQTEHNMLPGNHGAQLHQTASDTFRQIIGFQPTERVIDESELGEHRLLGYSDEQEVELAERLAVENDGIVLTTDRPEGVDLDNVDLPGETDTSATQDDDVTLTN